MSRKKKGNKKGKKKGIPDQQPPQSASRIPKAQVDREKESISFSFKLLDKKHSKFKYEGEEVKYFTSLIDMLKKISAMSVSGFCSGHNYNRTFRNHQIRFEETTEPKGYSKLHEQYQALPPYQFSSGRGIGRVYGFFLESVFFIVWLDPDHNLSPPKDR